MSFLNFFKKSEIALVGHNIKWGAIHKQVLRINEFDRNGTTIDTNRVVHAKSNFKPYGFLIVEWPIIIRKLKVPILHKDDFMLASSIFDNQLFIEKIKDKDLLVTYFPLDKKENKNAIFFHSLHFVITNPKVFEKYYEMRKKYIGCEPELIFNDFRWEGELKIKEYTNPIFEENQ